MLVYQRVSGQTYGFHFKVSYGLVWSFNVFQAQVSVEAYARCDRRVK